MVGDHETVDEVGPQSRSSGSGRIEDLEGATEGDDTGARRASQRSGARVGRAIGGIGQRLLLHLLARPLSLTTRGS